MKMRTLSLGLVALMCLPVSIQAKDRTDDWKIRFTPYLWGVSIDGTSQIGTFPPADVDAGFDDILSNLNFAASLHTEFAKGRWTFVIDPTYIALEIDDAIETSMPPYRPGPGDWYLAGGGLDFL